MKRVGAFVLYLVLWFALAGFLAPVLYAAIHPHFAVPFSRCVNRSLLVSALILLWPLQMILSVQTPREWGVAWPESGLHSVRLPFLAGLASIFALVAVALGTGWIQIAPIQNYRFLGSAVLAAVLVPFLEGLLFRGLFQFQLTRTLGAYASIALVSLLFAWVHFLKVPSGADPSPVTWASGFERLALAFPSFSQLIDERQRFVTVWAVGLTLSFVAWRDGHIWRSVAIHSGWVLGLQLARGFTEPGNAWAGIDPRLDGSWLTVGMIAVFSLCWFTAWDRHRLESGVNFLGSIKDWAEVGLDLLWPRSELPPEQTRKIVRPFCERCGETYRGNLTVPFRCENCGRRKWSLDWARAGYHADELVREAIHRVKYQGDYSLLHPLSLWLTEAFDTHAVEIRWTAFVPVPLHRLRLRERGFNQAFELAERLSHQRRIPCWDCLQRTELRPNQAQLTRARRIRNTRGMFQLKNGFDVKGTQLLIIDDVFTTGATADSCASVLRAAGASLVACLTVARA